MILGIKTIPKYAFLLFLKLCKYIKVEIICIILFTKLLYIQQITLDHYSKLTNYY